MIVFFLKSGAKTDNLLGKQLESLLLLVSLPEKSLQDAMNQINILAIWTNPIQIVMSRIQVWVVSHALFKSEMNRNLKILAILAADPLTTDYYSHHWLIRKSSLALSWTIGPDNVMLRLVHLPWVPIICFFVWILLFSLCPLLRGSYGTMPIADAFLFRLLRAVQLVYATWL